MKPRLTTVKQVKEDLRGWRLNRSVFVGDAGMDSFDNRKELSRGLGRFILAMPWSAAALGLETSPACEAEATLPTANPA